MIRTIQTSPNFDKHYKKLAVEIREQAKEKEKIFRNNPFDPTLRNHKLHGKDKHAWAFWIDYNYRIKFIFLDGGEVLFLDIGTHDIYK